MIEIEDALREHQAVIAALAPFAPEIRKAAHRMADCLAAGGKILWMGNGGITAESQHLALCLGGTSTITAQIEEVHLLIGHMLCDWIEASAMQGATTDVPRA